MLYGCETWSLTLREESRLRVFVNNNNNNNNNNNISIFEVALVVTDVGHIQGLTNSVRVMARCPLALAQHHKLEDGYLKSTHII